MQKAQYPEETAYAIVVGIDQHLAAENLWYAFPAEVKEEVSQEKGPIDDLDEEGECESSWRYTFRVYERVRRTVECCAKPRVCASHYSIDADQDHCRGH